MIINVTNPITYCNSGLEIINHQMMSIDLSNGDIECMEDLKDLEYNYTTFEVNNGTLTKEFSINSLQNLNEVELKELQVFANYIEK